MSKRKQSFIGHKQPNLPGMTPPELPDHRRVKSSQPRDRHRTRVSRKRR